MNFITSRSYIVAYKSFVLFFLILFYMTFLSWGNLSTYVYSMGDQAADMLIANQISDKGYVLVGHYSRWGFNHPGPFWLYSSKFFELILGWAKISREQIWQIGSLSISSIWITFFSVSMSFFLLNNLW